MKKEDYKKIKDALSKRIKNLKWFSLDFCKTYVACRDAVKNLTEDEYADSLYEMEPGVTVSHAWDPVYATDFYKKNSGAYCEFLSIFQ